MGELRVSRRAVLGAGMLGAAAMARSSALVKAAAAAGCDRSARLSDIRHVVILIQENQSFDHYFGTYRGVRGFDDRPAGRLGVFAQDWPGSRAGKLLPFHLDTVRHNGACANDIDHGWVTQHRSWHGGKLDRFVATHVAVDGPAYGTRTMGYHTRDDLPFLYALADEFTICDRYHHSVLGPTYPNRLYSMTATIDPEGHHGGPVVENPAAGLDDFTGLWDWKTMPEALQQAGVSWKVYNQLGTNNNMLSLFKRYRDMTSPLFRQALLPTFPGEFEADVASGQLPQVSWILAPENFDEHPPAPPAWGEWVTSQVLSTLVSNPSVWAHTVLFVTYDENGGHFDHVPPPAAPPGTVGEWIPGHVLPSAAAGIAGPIGLGFRVPCLVVSPFSRGGLVCSDTFDHTSLLRFLETRWGVPVPNLSAWRRSVTGDLTAALDLAVAPDVAPPALPAPAPVTADLVQQCGGSLVDAQLNQNLPVDSNDFNVPPYPPPAAQSMPRQEPGRARRPRGAAPRCAPA
jgi:phospholipase C